MLAHSEKRRECFVTYDILYKPYVTTDEKNAPWISDRICDSSMVERDSGPDRKLAHNAVARDIEQAGNLNKVRAASHGRSVDLEVCG
jgi:hypothetical protein